MSGRQRVEVVLDTRWSQAVRAWAYFGQARLLVLAFRDGRVYAYRDVPRWVPRRLRRTRSVGDYVSRRVAPRFAAFELSLGDKPLRRRGNHESSLSN